MFFVVPLAQVSRPQSQLAKPQPLLRQSPLGPLHNVGYSGRATQWPLKAKGSPDASPGGASGGTAIFPPGIPESLLSNDLQRSEQS